MDDETHEAAILAILCRMRPTDQLLALGIPLQFDRGFTSLEATVYGLDRKMLRRLVDSGVVRQIIRGVYAATDLELTVLVRARAIALVVPPNCVITDETAAWLHGVDLLDHRGGLPTLQFVRIHGDTRLRRTGVVSGTRMFVARDLVRVHGVWVTTPQRTALDLGRKRGPARALGALDGLLRTGTFTVDDLERELIRFKGFRGVVQLRALIPMADARAESPAESRLRYEWLATGLPKPDLQIKIYNPFSQRPWRIDLGLEAIKYGAEYDGEEWHADEERRERDGLKRRYIRDELGWTIDVLTKPDLYGGLARPASILRAGVRAARLNLGLPSSDEWRWPDGTNLSG